MQTLTQFLEGSNVLIFDTETTGLPARIPGFHNDQSKSYYDPTDNSKYDSSRLCQIAWVYIEKFNVDKLKDAKINSYIRKPLDFKINNSEFHGITTKIAKEKGLLFSKILSCKNLKYDLDNADYIIAHNVMFDVHILLNELYRLDYMNTYQKLMNKYENGQLICTCEMGRNICKISTKYRSYKLPKLQELYFHYFGEYPKIAHTADADVATLVAVIEFM